MYQRACDYCKKTIEGAYYYITFKSKNKDKNSHMCIDCWTKKAQTVIKKVVLTKRIMID